MHVKTARLLEMGHTSRVHCKIDRRAASKDTASGHNGLPAVEVIRLVSLVYDGRLSVRCQMVEISGGVDHVWIIEIVLAVLDEEDGEVGVCFRQATSDYASSSAT